MLWLASHPRREMDDWLEVLAEAGAQAGGRPALAARPARRQPPGRGPRAPPDPGARRRPPAVLPRPQPALHPGVPLARGPGPAALGPGRRPGVLRRRRRGAGPAPAVHPAETARRGADRHCSPWAWARARARRWRPRPGPWAWPWKPGPGAGRPSCWPGPPGTAAQGRLDLIPAEVREARSRRVCAPWCWAALAGMALSAPGPRASCCAASGLEREAARAEEALAQPGRHAPGQEAGAAALRPAAPALGRGAPGPGHGAHGAAGAADLPDAAGGDPGEGGDPPGPGRPAGDRSQVEGTARDRARASPWAPWLDYQHLAVLPRACAWSRSRTVPVRTPAGPGAERALTRFRLEGTAP